MLMMYIGIFPAKSKTHSWLLITTDIAMILACECHMHVRTNVDPLGGISSVNIFESCSKNYRHILPGNYAQPVRLPAADMLKLLIPLLASVNEPSK